MSETRIYAEIPALVDGETEVVVVTHSGNLPSVLHEKHHSTYENTLLELGIRAVGRGITMERQLQDDAGRIVYRTEQTVTPDQIQPGYRLSD